MSPIDRRTLLTTSLGLGAAGLVGTAGPAAAATGNYTRYRTYFTAGPGKIPWSGTRWVPQGLTKLSESQLAISYYHYDNTANSRLAVISRTTGALLGWFDLGLRGHVGGAAARGAHLWIANGGKVHRYDANYLRAHLSTAGRSVRPQTAFAVAASSYASSQVTARGTEYLWVGKCNETARDWMYAYRVTSTGGLVYAEKVYTPSKVQGVVVGETKIVWSQSWGTDHSKIIVWPRGTTYNGDFSKGSAIAAPPRSEGLVVANGEVQVVYESASSVYGSTPYRQFSVHHGSFTSLPL